MDLETRLLNSSAHTLAAGRACLQRLRELTASRALIAAAWIESERSEIIAVKDLTPAMLHRAGELQTLAEEFREVGR
ncbi:MAG TPA: hypothetical protein VGO11_19725 [Chthoniobacteraceae bacterium]|jgi:hypothetical protein|nr:hypothetical protein [Chthoniobacteraceae bacterium]